MIFSWTTQNRTQNEGWKKKNEKAHARTHVPDKNIKQKIQDFFKTLITSIKSSVIVISVLTYKPKWFYFVWNVLAYNFTPKQMKK